ncbi:MAG: NAD(P)-dependent oxidoreductase [Verrucomicrobia bacterium]|nr:NAD(P)-dependent oxidoreductase [Verrucomicrobiota bacterium]
MNEGVLVTGADGFIGTHLVRALRAAGHKVFAHSRRHGDIAHCALDFAEVGHVFHLAARTFVPESWSVPLAFYEVNVLGTVNVLEFCRRGNASMTLMSSYVYGRPARLPIGEADPLEAFNPYSHSKILAEETSRYYERQFGVPVTIMRPFNIYGPGQDRRFLIPAILTQLIETDTSAIVVADLRPRRDYLFISDLIELLMRTVFRREGGIFNAGSGSSWGVEEVVAIANQLVPTPKSARSEGDPRRDEVLNVVADISRAQHEFRWEPKVSLHGGLRETLVWMQASQQPA